MHSRVSRQEAEPAPRIATSGSLIIAGCANRSLRSAADQGAGLSELFFDLVFVFAVTQITSVLAHDLTASESFERHPLLACVVGMDAVHLVAERS